MPRRCHVIAGLAAVTTIFIQSVAGHAADDRVWQRFWPDHQAKISSVSVGSPAEPLYQVRLSVKGAAPVIVDTYMRDIELAWSANSRYLALTDWIGSNVADCYVIDTTRPRKRVSMTSALLPEKTANAHLYVSCETWADQRHVNVRVNGHTDFVPYRSFNDIYLFDAARIA